MIRIVKCEYCGQYVELDCGPQRIYCSDACRYAMLNKQKMERRAAAAKAKKNRALTEPPCNPKQCQKCLYGGYLFPDYRGCNYIFVTGKSRVQLHPEGLGPDCKEFEPRRGRSLRANFSLDGGETTYVQYNSGPEKELDDLRRLKRKILVYAKEEGERFG